MAPENAKNTTKKEATAEETRVQDQVLDAIKRSQESALKIVSAWSENVAKLTPKLPEMPKLPLIDSLPKPEEVSDQFFEFAQQLLDAQQEFVKKLIDTLPGHDKPSE
jgi:3-methyladenine DNA glycosylase AlkC